MRSDELRELVVRDTAAWRKWLATNHNRSDGVWLVLSKAGATRPTRLTYDDALEEALVHGWIDGQGKGRDDVSYRVRFTPRRKQSKWSKRNTVIAERLISEGRMHAAGYKVRDGDEHWEQFSHLRGKYASALNLMATNLVAPPAPWVGDRSYLPHRNRPRRRRPATTSTADLSR